MKIKVGNPRCDWCCRTSSSVRSMLVMLGPDTINHPFIVWNLCRDCRLDARAMDEDYLVDIAKGDGAYVNQ